MPNAQLREELNQLDQQDSAPKKLRHSLDLVRTRWFSSLQVKAICARLPSDGDRLEFASAAFPRVVDPENFYDVYDAFNTFSKVMRLHDRVRDFRRGDHPAPVAAPQPVSEENLQSMIKTLRGEPFDDTRTSMAKQILQDSRKRFASRQIVPLLKCFKFEENRLEMAKFAYDSVLDPENYYLIHEVFTFTQSREELARYIQSKAQPANPR